PAGPQTRLSPVGPIQPLAALQQSTQELPATALRAVERSEDIRPVVKEFVAPKPPAPPPNEIDGITIDHIPFQFDDAILIDDLPRPEPLPEPKPKPEVEASQAEAKPPEIKQAEVRQAEVRQAAESSQTDATAKLHQTAERGYLASRDAQRAKEPVEIKLPSDKIKAKAEAKPAEEPPENLVKKLAEKLQPVEE
ncbi:MAG: hypothetical protein ACOH2M_10355, partial [Cypionkella sp.]